MNEPVAKRARVEELPSGWENIPCAAEYFAGQHGCEEFIELFIDKHESVEQKRAISFHKREFSGPLTKMCRNTNFGTVMEFIVLHVRMLYASIAELSERAVELWDEQREKPFECVLFDWDNIKMFKSILYLAKSCIFAADYTPDYSSTRRYINKLYRRTIFMLGQKTGNDIFHIVQNIGSDECPEWRLLFTIKWLDSKEGTFFIEKMCDDIPAILEGFEEYTGSDGRTIYNEFFKGKKVADFNVLI